MIAETIIRTTPLPEDPAPAGADTTVTPDKPISSDTGQDATPQEPLIGPSPNAFRHGCASNGQVMTPRDKAKADKLFDSLCKTYQPKTDNERQLLRDHANSRTLAERCQEIGFALLDNDILAADLHWDTDQAIAAEQLALKLPKAPGVVSKQLSQTLQGVAVLTDYWTRLGQVLETSGTWTGSQRALALNLLGVPWEFREAGQTPFDTPHPDGFPAVARGIVQRPLQLLRDKAALNKHWDSFRHDMAILGVPVQISPEMRLMKRYEAMHIRRATQAMAEFERLRGGGEAGKETTPKPKVAVGLTSLRTRMQQATKHAGRYEAKSQSQAQPVKPAAPAASVAPVTPKAAVAPRPSQGSMSKPSHAPQPNAPHRDRETERAKKKAERDARKKARKQR